MQESFMEHNGAVSGSTAGLTPLIPLGMVLQCTWLTGSVRTGVVPMPQAT